MPECRSRDGPVTVISEKARPRKKAVMAGVSAVPLAGVADERNVRLQCVAMRGEKRRQTWTAGFLLAFQQHGDVDGERAMGVVPGAAGLEEGHHLAFVVGGAARDDDLAVLWVVDELRFEGRRGPRLQRVGRLHVVMTVEEDMRAGAAVGIAPMRQHHGLAGGRLDARGEADVAQGGSGPFRGLHAGIVIGGVGRDARDGEERKQPGESGFASLGETIEHAGKRAVRHALIPPSMLAAARLKKIPLTIAGSKDATIAAGSNVRF